MAYFPCNGTKKYVHIYFFYSYCKNDKKFFKETLKVFNLSLALLLAGWHESEGKLEFCTVTLPNQAYSLLEPSSRTKNFHGLIEQGFQDNHRNVKLANKNYEFKL